MSQHVTKFLGQHITESVAAVGKCRKTKNKGNNHSTNLRGKNRKIQNTKNLKFKYVFCPEKVPFHSQGKPMLKML